MRRNRSFTTLTSLFLLFSFCAYPQIRLPRLVRDSMVLQRDVAVGVWGTASAGEKIRIRFNGHAYRTTADSKGNWLVKLMPAPAGGPYTMDIRGKNKITLHDILIGDVWLCSGQSNMVHQMRLHSVRYQDEIDRASFPEIRQFWIPTLTDPQGPHNDLPAGEWKSATPANVLEFSAVAYFFARNIHEKYHIPIGLINASVGGSPIEAWISTPVAPARNHVDRPAPRPPQDKGLTSPIPWYSPSYVPKGWRQIAIPGYWEDQGLKDLDGVVWYRREIEVPASMTNQPARIFLGRIVDADALYINGQLVGSTTYMYPQRRYAIPAGLLKPGKNLFVVRVTNNFGKGGFVPDKPYALFAGKDTIDLKGYWQYKVGEVYPPHRGPGGGGGPATQNSSAALYNAMLAPLTRYAIKGFLWYQGEANTGRAAEYAKLQPAMIADWRQKWKEGDLPFLFVQLPGFGDYNYQPSESQWAELREAQARSLTVPNTAMAVAIDLGEWNDIHPDRKKEVGDRLALAARKLVYGENLIAAGPTFRSAEIEGNKIALHFDNADNGLITNDGEDPQEFAIAGADGKFVWANARIDGDKVILQSDMIKEPKYIRYAWADDPVNPNLYNKEGLPAAPFRATL